MSQRHIRKILQSRSSLDDDGDSGGEEDAAPTMKPTAGSTKKKKPSNVVRPSMVVAVQQVSQGSVEQHDDQPQPATKTQQQAPRQRSKREGAASVVVVTHVDPTTAPNPMVDVTDEKDAARAKKKADSRRRARAKQEEEEQVLEAALRQATTDHMNGGPDIAASASPIGLLRAEVLRLLSTPVTSCLNTRTERIRSFGADSVEDVGDGPTRRAGPNGAAIPQNGLLPTRPQGFTLPKYRDSPLATPNRYYWPPFSALGVTVRRADDKAPGNHTTSGSPTLPRERRGEAQVFAVDWSDKECVTAQSNFDAFVSRMADINQMLEGCFQKYPFHLPTLVQLHRAFATMGDAPNSQLMLDMAMYTVGVLLSSRLIPSSSSSSEAQSSVARQLPYATAGNRIVFETLKLGVQLALKRGCNRTAFNLHRLVLSLDITDPCATLLSWDYLALRAREWDTILNTHSAAELLLREQLTADMMRQESSNGGVGGSSPGLTASNFSSTPSPLSQHDTNTEVLARLYFALPGAHFCAALAKFLKEQLEEQTSINKHNAAARNGGATVKAAAPSSSTERVEAVGPSDAAPPTAVALDSRALMAITMLRFPHAAWMLAEKLDLEINVTRDKGWGLLRELRGDLETGTNGAQLSKAALHVAKLFVERCFELFKTKEASVLLMSGAARLGDAAFMDSVDMFQIGAERQEFACTPLLRRYRATSLEDVVGETIQRIPQELLNPAANMDEVQRDARAQEAQHLAEHGFPQEELDALQRFEAVFGPLPVEVPLQQRFEMYDEMLQQYRQEIGNDTHPVMLFLQTLLPWGGNLRDIALRRAMDARGVEDPVARRVARQRRRDEQVWQAAEDEAQQQEDDESSSDEGW